MEVEKVFSFMGNPEPTQHTQTYACFHIHAYLLRSGHQGIEKIIWYNRNALLVKMTVNILENRVLYRFAFNVIPN